MIDCPASRPRRVNAEINRALADPKMRERRRTAKWGKVVTSSGAKVE